jgi:hypothetical protein
MALLMAERIDRPPLALFGELAEERGDVSGGPTLDDAVVAAWEGLTARVAVACLLCDEGLMRALPRRTDDCAGACDRCGATLA